jgi:hypothetical protein
MSCHFFQKCKEDLDLMLQNNKEAGDCDKMTQELCPDGALDYNKIGSFYFPFAIKKQKKNIHLQPGFKPRSFSRKLS